MAGNTALPRLVAETIQALVGALNQIIDRVERALNVLEAHPFAGMVLATQVVTTADTRVYHGLGRIPIGYFIVRASAGAVVFDSPTAPETIDPSNYIVLRATSGTPTVTLAVF